MFKKMLKKVYEGSKTILYQWLWLVE